MRAAPVAAHPASSILICYDAIESAAGLSSTGMCKGGGLEAEPLAIAADGRRRPESGLRPVTAAVDLIRRDRQAETIHDLLDQSPFLPVDVL